MRMFTACAAIMAFLSLQTWGAPDASTGVAKCDVLMGQHEKAVEQLDNDLLGGAQDAMSAYDKGLDALLALMQKQGKLDAYLAVKKEKDRFVSEKSVPAKTGQPDIDHLIATYEEALAAGRAAHAKSLLVVNQKYTNALEVLIKDLVRANEIESATEANVELTRARDLVRAAQAAAEDLEPDANPPPRVGADKPDPKNGHDPAVPASATVIRMQGSGPIEAWKPSKITVAEGDWVSVKILNVKRDAALAIKRAKKVADKRVPPPTVTVTVKNRTGGECVAVKDRWNPPRRGQFRVPKDGLLQYMCAGDNDVSAEVEISVTKTAPAGN